MKRPLRSIAVLLFLLILQVGFAHGQQLTVEPEAGKKVVFQYADIAALPHVKVTVASTTYEGIDLRAVLEKAGVEFGQTLRGKRLASCLLAEAVDGNQVVIALPELHPAFTDKQIALVFLKDGKPLDDKEGSYRIVIPSEKRMARWVRQVKALKIVNMFSPFES